MSQAIQKKDFAGLPASELFEIAKKAAAAKKPDEMIEALAASLFLDGLVLRLSQKWGQLPISEIEECVARAVDHAYAYLAEKRRITNLDRWLYKVADNLAHDMYYKDYIHRTGDSEATLSHIHSENQLPDAERLRQDDIAESRKAEGIRLARELLPEIGHGQVVKVMELLIDAIEQGIPDLPAKDIADTLGITPDAARTLRSRGFNRLARRARERGIEIPECCVEDEYETNTTSKK